jgi:hypothetical protein
MIKVINGKRDSFIGQDKIYFVFHILPRFK